MSTEYVYEHYKAANVDAMDGDNTFVKGVEVNAMFRLNAGQHTLVVFTDSPNQPLRYVISCERSDVTPLQITSFNTQHEMVVINNDVT